MFTREKRVAEQPDYGPALCILALIDAGVGRKGEALREGRRAMELLPVEKPTPRRPALRKDCGFARPQKLSRAARLFVISSRLSDSDSA